MAGMMQSLPPARVGREAPVAATLTGWIRRAFDGWCARLMDRSMAISRFLDCRIEAVALAWLAVFSLAALPRLLLPQTPVVGIDGLVRHVLPYALIALAPIAGFLVAAGSFPRGILNEQPHIRLALWGRWRKLSVLEARQNPAYGPRGFVVSLLIGMLLNVVVRTLEFLASMPAMGSLAPEWGNRLFMATAADVIVMNFFYVVCFVMALRSVPLFPRMLVLAWGIDIMMQLTIWHVATGTPGVPLAVSSALMNLLQGNITKVMISAVVWLPYLLLSERINVTYRNRVPG